MMQKGRSNHKRNITNFYISVITPLYDADNALYDVLRILKYLGQLTISSYANHVETMGDRYI